MQVVVDLSAFPDLAESLGAVSVGDEVSGTSRYLLSDRDEKGDTVTLDLISFEPDLANLEPEPEIPPAEAAPEPLPGPPPDNGVTRLFG